MSDEVDYEKQAKAMGWVPQEQWKGDPEKWTDAQEYVERGEQVLPILRANNRRLNDDILTLRNQNDTLQQELAATRSIVQGLEKNFNESLERQLKEQRASLKASLKEAVEDRDVDRELEIRDQLDNLTEAERASKAKQAENKKKLDSQNPPDPKPQPKLDQNFEAWKRENPWFDGDSAEDRRRTKAVVRAAEDLRDDGDTSTGMEFYNKALERAEGGSNNSNNRSPDKVDGSNSRSSSRGGAKTFASLPQEAKDACLADSEEFVGEGKLFKTEQEWKDYYTKTYYGAE